MNSIASFNLVPLLGTVLFLLFFVLAALFYRSAWIVLIVSNLLTAYSPFLNGNWLTVSLNSIVIAMAIYGLVRWNGVQISAPQKTGFSDTLDDLQHFNPPTAKIRIHSITQQEIAYSIGLFFVVICLMAGLYYYFAGLLLLEGALSMHMLLFSITIVGFFWLAQKIYQTWFLLLGIFAFRIAYFLYLGFSPDFMVQIPLILICIFGVVRWQNEWLLRKKADTI